MLMGEALPIKRSRLDSHQFDRCVMGGGDTDVCVGNYPLPNTKGSRSCACKTCFPWYCPVDQGWTDPKQVNIGSPAGTACYKGKMDFKVVFCR